MKNRCLAAVAALVLVFDLAACASILDDEMYSETAHVEPPVSTESLIVASTYEELKNDMLGFVRNHEETGIIRIYGYDGDIQADADRACSEIMNDVPIGAYAVESMKAVVAQIVSYYEVEVRIAYRNVTKEQLDSISAVSTVRYLKSDLFDTLSSYAPSLTVLAKNIELTPDGALALVNQIYYENPLDIVMAPVTTVAFYPEHGRERIIEFTFGYRYEESTLNVMERTLRNTVQRIAESVSGGSDGAILLSLAERLADITSYDAETASSGEYSNQNIAATAYGAIVTGSAVGEGYAMAYKALCDELGIECYVVLGSRDLKPHAWNIVAIDGDYYHVDVSMCDLVGFSEAFLKNDQAMEKKSYRWDKSQYKACSGKLSYADFAQG